MQRKKTIVIIVIYMPLLQIVLYFFTIFILGILTKRYAEKKGYGPVWFYLGCLFGLLALVVLFFLPTKKKERKKELFVNTLTTSPFSNVQWFYLDPLNQQIGPITFAELSKSWEEKITHTKTFVWSESLVDWEIIENLPDLKQELQSSTSSP